MQLFMNFQYLARYCEKVFFAVTSKSGKLYFTNQGRVKTNSSRMGWDHMLVCIFVFVAAL